MWLVCVNETSGGGLWEGREREERKGDQKKEVHSLIKYEDRKKTLHVRKFASIPVTFRKGANQVPTQGTLHVVGPTWIFSLQE
jgi:hypothetical protein